MKPPPFTAVFTAQFPGWGGDGKPFFHDEMVYDEQKSEHVLTGKKQTTACDMPCHTYGGTCISIRFDHTGPVGIDRKGGVWLLVRDYKRADNTKFWIKYPGQVIP